jgi:hypothetical protein
MTQETKAKREAIIFKRFAPSYSRQLNIETLRSRNPPEPDIEIAVLDGETISFELREITDQGLAKSFGSGKFEGGFLDDSLIPGVKSKFNKEYETKYPIELLLFYDSYPVDLARYELSEAEEYIRSNISKPKYRSVWIFAYHENKVLRHIDRINS